MAEKNGNLPEKRWHEVLRERGGEPRIPYPELLGQLEGATTANLRELEERLDATLRELGVTFEVPSGEHHNTWFCDLLPQVFTSEEWSQIVRGFEQRIRAFDMLLADVYGQREILKQGVIPIPAILGSPNYQRSAAGLQPGRRTFFASKRALSLPGQFRPFVGQESLSQPRLRSFVHDSESATAGARPA